MMWRGIGMTVHQAHTKLRARQRMYLDCTTWVAMFGSGAMTGMAAHIIAATHGQILPVPRVGLTACCAVVAGATSLPAAA